MSCGCTVCIALLDLHESRALQDDGLQAAAGIDFIENSSRGISKAERSPLQKLDAATTLALQG
jgi:hypothetical protein